MGSAQIGLPPSGSPQKRKLIKKVTPPLSKETDQYSYSGTGNKPVKPPSNYSRGSRHVSQNRVAGGNKALPALGPKRMGRERSSDAIGLNQNSGGLAADQL
jgi:hypothetical protein